MFEAHQVADMKILKDKLITGGYNRTICIWYWESGKRYCCLEGSIKPGIHFSFFLSIILSRHTIQREKDNNVYTTGVPAGIKS